MGFCFNPHLFHVGTGRLTARDEPNPQVGWDGTTGKYCLVETQARGVVGPLAEPEAYEKSNPGCGKNQQSYESMTRQAVKPGRPGHLTGMERPISSVQAGERSENGKPALPRLDLRAEPEARALAGLRCDRRRCLQGREFAFLLRILRGTSEGSYKTRGQQSYAHKLPNKIRFTSE